MNLRINGLCVIALAIATLLPSVTNSHKFTGLKTKLEKLLRANGVPGAGVADIYGNQIVWADGVGLIEAGKTDQVKPDTLFQAASISKPVAAFGALRLVQDGKLNLDIPVGCYIKTDQVPTRGAVTLRQLLSHNSGLSIHGFAGYRPGSEIPTLQQIPSGDKPANSGTLGLSGRPGAEYKYSGGGYRVVQQMILASKQHESGLVIMTNGENVDKLYEPIHAVVRTALARK